MPKTLDFLFSPIDGPGEEAKESNPLAQDSTRVPEAIASLEEAFGDDVLGTTRYANEDTVYVKKSRIVEVCAHLKEMGFTYLSHLAGIDLFTEEDRFEVFYSLINMQAGKRVRIKVRVDEEDATVPSVVSVYMAANWNEREVWDMLGIRFDGHPDMRRLFMPEDFEYHPQRKEFPALGVPGSLPLPSQKDDGQLVHDPYPAAHGLLPLRRTPKSD